jgi:hypothetical protein
MALRPKRMCRSCRVVAAHAQCRSCDASDVMSCGDRIIPITGRVICHGIGDRSIPQSPGLRLLRLSRRRSPQSKRHWRDRMRSDYLASAGLRVEIPASEASVETSSLEPLSP